MTRLGILALSAALACTPRSTTPPDGAAAPNADGPGRTVGYPGTLRPPAAMGPDVQWEQHVTATYGGEAHSFDAVLSKTDAEMLLIGLGPMKTPGFVVRLEDTTVTLDNRLPQDVPFDPRYIILDVQRVYFPWIDGEAPRSGTREHDVRGERVVERFADGHLVERRFTRLDGQPAGEIVVAYDGWQDGADAPRSAVLENGWFGYRLEIETVSQQRL